AAVLFLCNVLRLPRSSIFPTRRSSDLEQAQTELAGGAVARRFELAASLSGAKTVSQSEPSRAWWTNLEPYLLDWECCLTEFQSRSEEHTSELQSPYDLVCRLLLEKKKK